MTEQNAEGVLKTLHTNAIEHRKQLLKNAANEMRKIVQILNIRAAEAMTILDDPKAVFEGIDDSIQRLRTLQDIYAALGETMVTLRNIENLTHGRIKSPDRTPAPKGPSNVTQLPRKAQSPTQASGGTFINGKDQGADNPGRERQRQRKQSQDDK